MRWVSFLLVTVWSAVVSANEIPNHEGSLALIKEISSPGIEDVSPLCSGDNIMLRLANYDGQYNPAYPRHSFLGSCTQSRFKKIKMIGKGAYGVIYKAIHLDTRSEVTLKVISYDHTSYNRLRLEECMQHRVTLPTIRKHLCTFLIDNGAVMVLEYVEGMTMAAYAKEYHPVPKALLTKWAAQLSVTLMALHLRSVAYMDLTPNNILVSACLDIKLIDFGLATDPSKTFHGISTNGLIGTAYYAAPETTKDVLIQRSDVSFVRLSSDWYSLGIVLYRAATRKHLYDFKVLKQMCRQNHELANRTLYERIQLGLQITDEDRSGREELTDFITAITVINPVERLGTSPESYPRILTNPIFKDHPNLKRLVGMPSL
jgi:serine/threonine protein kinase